MLSIPDMAILGAAALLIFGPEQLPKVARKAGGIMRDLQNTSQSFIREMERAADAHDVPGAPPPAYDALAGWDPLGVDHDPHAALSEPVAEKLAEPSPALEGREPSAAPAHAAQPPPQGEHPPHV